MRLILLCVVLLGIPSLVSGADAPSVWLPRVASTRQVTKNVVTEGVGACAGGACQVKKSVLVKKEIVQTQRVRRIRFWR